MHKRNIILTSSTLAACAAAIALLWLLGGGLSAHAALALSAVEGPVEALADELRVCPSGCTYSSIQAAVDAADPGDVIKIAQGTYTGVQNIPSLNTATFTATQVVAITKSVTIRGGYTTVNWTTPYPITQPTTLDAQRQGRVLVITGTITSTVEGLRITGGDAVGLGGFPWGDVGGSIYVNAAMAVISGNLVYSNTAGNGNSYGGGLGLISSDATLNGNTVSSNTAHHGSGLYLRYSPATLSNNVIRNNGDDVSGWGGGVYLAGSAATLRENIVTGNTGGYGGGVNVQGGTAVLRGNTITGNTGYRGGGLYLYTGSATVSDNVITGNTASDQGGGVYFWSNSSTLINTAVADNRLSSGLGAGLYLDGASAPRLLHVTIARNSGGDGSGVYVTNWSSPHYSSVAMTNTIIVSHTVGITVTTGNTATLNGTLWHANTITQSGNVIHTNDRSGDPAFAADGYHLTLGSVAIDRGVSAGVDTDIDGETRPLDDGYDIGADELEVRRVYLPLVLRG
jgi:hypothetical protein